MTKALKTAAYYKDPARETRVLVVSSDLAAYMRTLMTPDPKTGWVGLNADDMVTAMAYAMCEVTVNKRLGPGALIAVAQELNERATLAINPTPTQE